MSLNSCGSKKVYYTKTQARNAVREQRLKYGNRMYFYKCEECWWWHLSSSDHKKKPYVIRSIGIVFFR